MTKDTLRMIHNRAMVEADSIVNIEPNRKYEWELWGYLQALYDFDIIDLDEYLKLKKHYRKYFKELTKYVMSLRKIQPKLGQLARSVQDGNLYADDGKPIVGKEKTK